MKLLFAVAALELVYLTRGVEYLLLTGVKRMAGRANFYVKIFSDSRACDKSIAAAARNIHFFVLWMDICFHHNTLCRRGLQGQVL